MFYKGIAFNGTQQRHPEKHEIANLSRKTTTNFYDYALLSMVYGLFNLMMDENPR